MKKLSEKAIKSNGPGNPGFVFLEMQGGVRIV
jgi:hypothetical protein